MLLDYLKNTPRIAVTIIGFACALLVPELQRMPAAYFVDFSIFAPLPYLIQVIVLLMIAVIYWKNSSLRLSDHLSVRIVIAISVLIFSYLILNKELAFSATEEVIVQSAYRSSSACMLICWCERLLSLGARSAALTFSFSCIFASFLLLLLAIPAHQFLLGLLIIIVLVAGLSLVFFKPERSYGSISQATKKFLESPLPKLPFQNKKEILLAGCLIILPLLCRGPVASIQSVWMPYQSSTSASFFIQICIGCGVLVAGLVCLFVVCYVWNQKFILIYEFLILPITFLAFYVSLASSELWMIYLLIIDATYKVTLFYLFSTAMLFPEKSNQLLPLLISFSFMILARIVFVLLHSFVPETVFIVITTIVVLIAFVGGSILSLMIIQRGYDLSARKGKENITNTDVVLAKKCLLAAEQFSLTAREAEILGFLAQKYNAPYVAKKLVLSQSTVKTHMRNIYAKLKIHSQADLYLLLDDIEIGTETDSV